MTGMKFFGKIKKAATFRMKAKNDGQDVEPALYLQTLL